MDRRNAIAIAIAVGGTVLASGAAFAANVGLLQENDDPVGQLETTNVSELLDGSTSARAPQKIVIDVPVGTTGDDGTPDQGPGDAVTSGSDDGSDDAYDDHGSDDDHDEGTDDHGGFDDDDD